MDEWEIPVKLGVKVGYSSGGLIRISQQNEKFNEEAVILLHPEDIQQLVQYLEAAKQELDSTEDN